MRLSLEAGILGALLLNGGALAACPPAPLPIRDITANTFYTDARHSVVDPALMARYRQSVKPLEDFQGELARFASRSQGGKAEWGACAGIWLAAWARGEALLGTMNSERGIQAQYVRKWSLAALSMVYLRAQADIVVADRAVIAPWLVRVADRVEAEYGSRLAEKSRNNHYYWLGFALAAAGEAGNADHLRARARKIYEEALGHIRPDGHLPREAARGTKALQYHNFALFPLVMMAEFAARRGEDSYNAQDGALHRLVGFTLQTRRDPASLAHLAGEKQEPLTARQPVWFPLYARRFPERVANEPDLAGEKYWSRMAGGDMNLLARDWIR